MDAEIELVVGGKVRILRKHDILRLRVTPEYDELKIRKFVVRLPEKLVKIAEKRALEMVRSLGRQSLVR